MTLIDRCPVCGLPYSRHDHNNVAMCSSLAQLAPMAYSADEHARIAEAYRLFLPAGMVTT